jgi:plasmid stabilization system protein ParE
MKLIFSPQAREDMENIYHYYDEHSETYATELYNGILKETEILRHYPLIAQIEPLLAEFEEQYRSLIVKVNYKVVYYIENEKVNIAAVFDCRQNPQKLIKSSTTY